MAFKKVKGTLERVLDKNLQDLVRGIRNHKDAEVVLNSCVIHSLVALKYINLFRLSILQSV